MTFASPRRFFYFDGAFDLSWIAWTWNNMAPDLRVRLAGAFTACSWGGTSGPGTFAHYPGGLVVAFPAAGTVDGRVVLAPGDINLTFKTYVQSPITLEIAGDRVTAGQPIGAVPEKALGAIIHAPFAGTVAEVTATHVVLNREI